MLNDKNVKRLYENLEVKSILTATVSLRNLGHYCEIENTNPRGIIREIEGGSFRDKFLDFVRRLEKKERQVHI
ncbi:MAG: hypothetical protein QXH93_04655 [Conexivisphaerales archaeon]